MFASIRGRLWLSYAALIIAALAIVAIVLVVFLLRNPYLYRQTSIRIRAAEGLLLRDPASVGRNDVVAEALDVRVLVYSADGVVLSDSATHEPPLRASVLDRPLRRAEAIKDTDGNPWLHSRARLPEGNWLVVAARRPGLLPALDLLGDELWRPLLQGGLVALALALILAYLLARWIADPLQRLVEAARAVGVGATRAPKRGQRAGGAGPGAVAVEHVPERGPREVREFTRAFNAMLDRVEASQRSQKEFVANVSHELKTPLTSIQGFSQAILDGTADNPAARRQAAEIIYTEAGRMHRMALDLLDLARLDAGTVELKLAAVDLPQLLQSLIAEFRPLAESAGVALVLLAGSQHLHVNGDIDRLAQVLRNLIDNALKFTPPGGRVELRLVQVEDEVQVAVTDTGPGIAAGDIPQIFERFYQADSSRGGGKPHGAGLGLAIARELTIAHGGRISVRSALGHGTEFIVHLPPQEGRKVERGAA
jgi:signal transduction histidine kinase